MLSTNTPAIDAMAKAEAILSTLNHKNRYNANPTIPVVAITNKILLSVPASAWLTNLELSFLEL